MTPAIQTRGLAKRYRRVTALSDCAITVPDGRISALIGPNGAGKTTLLRLLAGLARPTAGEMAVLGGTPRQDPAFLAQIGYLAQEIPLYRRFTADDHIGIGAHLNRRWDAASVRDRLSTLNIPLDRKVGTLSGGQRAQVAADEFFHRGLLHVVASDSAVLTPCRRPGTSRRPPRLAGLLPGPAVRRHRHPAGRAPRPGRPAQGHHGDREDPHHRAGRAYRPPDSPVRHCERSRSRSQRRLRH